MTQAPPLQIPALRAVHLGRAIGVILLVSAVVFSFLFWLVYIKQAAGVHSRIIASLPAVNAGLNSLSTVFLVSGLIAILRKNYALHMRLMFAALVSSAAFFVCYVIYHNCAWRNAFSPNRMGLAGLFHDPDLAHRSCREWRCRSFSAVFFCRLSGRYSLHREVVENHLPDLAVRVGDRRNCFCVLENIRALMQGNPSTSLIGQAGQMAQAGRLWDPRRNRQLANRSPAFRPGLSILILLLVMAHRVNTSCLPDVQGLHSGQ